jgi:hypothetical protein
LGPLRRAAPTLVFRFAAIFWYSRGERKGSVPRIHISKRSRRRLGTCAPTEWGGYNFSLLGGSAGGFGFGGDGAFAPEAWVVCGETTLPCFFDSHGFASFAGLLQNGRGLPLLQRIFFVASCLRVSSWLTRISARRGRILSIPKIPSSASRRLCGRIWVGGRTARSRLKLGSPWRGDPFFDSRGFVIRGPAPKRQGTAVATTELIFFVAPHRPPPQSRKSTLG